MLSDSVWNTIPTTDERSLPTLSCGHSKVIYNDHCYDRAFVHGRGRPKTVGMNIFGMKQASGLPNTFMPTFFGPIRS